MLLIASRIVAKLRVAKQSRPGEQRRLGFERRWRKHRKFLLVRAVLHERRNERAASRTRVAYVFLFLIRWKECSRIMRLTIRWRSLAGYTVYGLAVSAITQFAGQYVNYALLAGTFILFVVLQWDLVRKGVTMIRGGLHDRRRSVHS